MIKNYITLIFVFYFAASIAQNKSAALQNDPDKKAEILQTVLKVLKTKHIAPKKIDDNFSRNFFQSFFYELDDYGYFFLQSDIDEFKKYETTLDESILKSDFTFFELVKNRYKMRLVEAKEIYTNILKNKLDFKSNAAFNPSARRINDQDFRKNKAELTERYNSGLKSIVLGTIKESYKPNTSKENFLKSALNIQETKLPNILDSSVYNVNNISKDYFFYKYLNAICLQYDPHCKYYLPFQRDEYIVKESGKIEGIGISMAVVNDFIVIDKISAGGPAFNTNKLQVGDIILKIGQENNEPENIINYNLYDIAKLTRGKAGTNIKLTVKKADGKIIIVPIKREVVSTNDSYIKSCIVNQKDKNFGVLAFKRFYCEQEEGKTRDVVDDFKNELSILLKNNVQGLIIDLRDNNSGTIDAAVKIIDNFVTKRKVAIYRKNIGKNIVSQTESETKFFDKNVVLLINSNTGSAAEMFAAAFQELNIGVILGETSCGNSSTRELLDVNQFKKDSNDNKDFGFIHVTTQKFYKLNGTSIQRIGVVPDIDFSTSNAHNREKDLSQSLLSDNIKPTIFKLSNKNGFFAAAINKSKFRLQNSEVYKSLKNDNFVTEFGNIQNLNPQIFQKTLDNILLMKQSSLIHNCSNNLEFLPTTNDEKTFKKKEYLLQKRKNWYKSLSQDFMIEESINILEDMLLLK